MTRGGKLIVKYSLDELDELLGYIAAEANHAENEKLERDLDRLYDRLEVYERVAKMTSILTGKCSSSPEKSCRFFRQPTSAVRRRDGD